MIQYNVQYHPHPFQVPLLCMCSLHRSCSIPKQCFAGMSNILESPLELSSVSVVTAFKKTLQMSREI